MLRLQPNLVGRCIRYLAELGFVRGWQIPSGCFIILMAASLAAVCSAVPASLPRILHCVTLSARE